MEILAIYLYGIYSSVEAVILISTIIVATITGMFTVVYVIQKSEYDTNLPKGETRTYYRNALPEYKANYENARKFMFIKTSIALIIINVLMPPKEIAVAMIAVNPAIKLAKDIKDSNRTQNIVEILDLSIARIKEKLDD